MFSVRWISLHHKIFMRKSFFSPSISLHLCGKLKLSFQRLCYSFRSLSPSLLFLKFFWKPTPPKPLYSSVFFSLNPNTQYFATRGRCMIWALCVQVRIYNNPFASLGSNFIICTYFSEYLNTQARFVPKLLVWMNPLFIIWVLLCLQLWFILLIILLWSL